MSSLLMLLVALALDGGVAPKPLPAPPARTRDAPKARVALSHEDEEVAANLELLEQLESVGDLELMQELSVER